MPATQSIFQSRYKINWFQIWLKGLILPDKSLSRAFNSLGILSHLCMRVNVQGEERGRCRHSTLQDHYWAKPVKEINADNKNKHLFLTARRCKHSNYIPETTQATWPLQLKKHSPQDRGKNFTFLPASLCKVHAFRNSLQKSLHTFYT